MHLTQSDIQNMARVERLKLLNSVTGIKPANLIGSISQNGEPNLAVFSSVTHLGSDPALIGFILRPQSEVRRDTYENILETKEYTINHIHSDFTHQAHYTSVKFPPETSEFQTCQLNPQYQDGFNAPFVAESKLKIGLSYVESLEIKSNSTVLVIGEIKHLVLPENVVDEQGYLDLCKLGSVGIGGLNSYYDLHKRRDYPYAREGELPDFNRLLSDNSN